MSEAGGEDAAGTAAGRPSHLRAAVGSNAGAGSGTFHSYQRHRRVEVERIEGMERETRREEKKREFAERVADHEKEAKERAAKNAARRKRRRGGKKEDGEEEEEEAPPALSPEEEAALLKEAQELEKLAAPSTNAP